MFADVPASLRPRGGVVADDAGRVVPVVVSPDVVDAAVAARARRLIGAPDGFAPCLWSGGDTGPLVFRATFGVRLPELVAAAVDGELPLSFCCSVAADVFAALGRVNAVGRRFALALDDVVVTWSGRVVVARRVAPDDVPAWARAALAPTADDPLREAMPVDVHAAALVLYTLLAGACPFDSVDAARGRAVLPPLPPKRAPASLERRLRAALQVAGTWLPPEPWELRSALVELGDDDPAVARGLLRGLFPERRAAERQWVEELGMVRFT